MRNLPTGSLVTQRGQAAGTYANLRAVSKPRTNGAVLEKRRAARRAGATRNRGRILRAHSAMTEPAKHLNDSRKTRDSN